MKATNSEIKILAKRIGDRFGIDEEDLIQIIDEWSG